MQMKNYLSILSLVIIFQIVSKNCIAKLRMPNATFRNYTDVIIGSKTNDSTGIVTLTNSQIQQNVIATIPLISHATIINTQPYISVGAISTYLIFKVTSMAGDTINIAVGLTTSTNNLSFSAGNEIHLCSANTNCTSCGFAMDNNRKIIGCYIKKSGNESEIFFIKD